MRFYNRQQELAELNKVMGQVKDGSRMAVLTGRRRVGKTLLSLEFVKDKKTKEPAPELIRPVIEGCANNGLLVGSVGMFGNVIRVAPPLVISRAEIDESVAILDKVLSGLKL